MITSNLTARTNIAGLLLILAAAAGACAVPGEERLGQTAAALDQTLLGTAQSFAVLGGSTVTNTGPSTIYGDLGVNPGEAITGFPPGLVAGGATHAGDAVALQAQNDTTTAYDTLAGQAPTANLTGQDLGGMTLTPGVYFFSSSAQLTGALTLDAEGDPNATFVFQIASTLTTASNASVVMLNGGTDCRVFWQVGSSATLGTDTAFKGNILALTSVTLNTRATVSGRAIARNAAVTLDHNDVSIRGCAGLPVTVVDGGVASDGGDGGAADAAPSDAGASDAGPRSGDSGKTW